MGEILFYDVRDIENYYVRGFETENIHSEDGTSGNESKRQDYIENTDESGKVCCILQRDNQIDFMKK